MPETYNEEAIQQILKLAMSRQGQAVDLTRSQLLDIADELGISEDNLAAAEQDWDIQCQEQADRLAFEAYRHLQLQQGIVWCLVINTALVTTNIVSNHTVTWAVYPVLIWGCVLALQAWRVYQDGGEEYDRAFRRWKLGQQIGESFKAITAQLNKTLTQPLGDGDRSHSPHSTPHNNDTSPI
ncbi:MAG: 2TM domain-containing protein [Leptolyngbyaceae bacterium]|nr:2TM domain-containing protein [Leptolyngbyaceae bacterium]